MRTCKDVGMQKTKDRADSVEMKTDEQQNNSSKHTFRRGTEIGRGRDVPLTGSLARREHNQSISHDTWPRGPFYRCLHMSTTKISDSGCVLTTGNCRQLLSIVSNLIKKVSGIFTLTLS